LCAFNYVTPTKKKKHMDSAREARTFAHVEATLVEITVDIMSAGAAHAGMSE
jgi:hypothetical protein